MPDLKKFPEYFRAYSWDAKHALYGYPADEYEQFFWIVSLEKRFNWLKSNCKKENTASIYLIKEMIQWGGSQNGTLQKFEDSIERHNLQQLMLETVSSLQSPKEAIEAALKFPGMGLTYASKMLRFLDPERYGALDSRIRKVFSEKVPAALPKIYDSSDLSMVTGYVAFTEHLDGIKEQLNKAGILRPKCALPAGAGSAEWRSADVEMALFGWASSHKG